MKWSASKTYDLSLAPRATAVGGSQGGGARLGIPGDVAVFCGTADGQCVDTVGVAVTITAVPVPTPVARRPHEDRPPTTTTLQELKHRVRYFLFVFFLRKKFHKHTFN